jgi:hypothetical protein
MKFVWVKVFFPNFSRGSKFKKLTQSPRNPKYLVALEMEKLEKRDHTCVFDLLPSLAKAPKTLF